MYYRYPSGGDFEYSPSEYAMEARNAKAAGYCFNLGM
jgi:hypothetical protein